MFINKFIVGRLIFIISLTVLSVQAADNNVFYVYDKAKNPSYAWYPSGWMPNGGGISFSENFVGNCKSDDTCIKVGFDAARKSWAGIYWLPPGSWKGLGINLYEKLNVSDKSLIKLTFWARGDEGGERAQFKVGGVADGNDSIEFAVETDYITLGKNWRQYEIDLSKENLSNVVGGFCWVTNKDENRGKSTVRFYLDDIRYELVSK